MKRLLQLNLIVLLGCALLITTGCKLISGSGDGAEDANETPPATEETTESGGGPLPPVCSTYAEHVLSSDPINGSQAPAQSFQVDETITLSDVDFYTRSNSAGYITVTLYEGGAGPEAGILIGTVVVNDLPPSLGWKTFEFDPTVVLSSGVIYYMVFTPPGGNQISYVWGAQSYAGGKMWINIPPWAGMAHDLNFRINGCI